MDEQFKQHGAFSWCELLTTDVDAAKAFYARLFGWKTEDMTMPGMTYTVVKAGNKEVGGIMAVPKEAQGMPPMWGAYVTVDDVDVTAKTAEQLGARLLVPPTDIPDVGRFCVIQDPQGAVINAITYKDMQ
jgi:predicted enzyme related to lactoylglutathione lyase